MSKSLMVFIEYDVRKEAVFQYKRVMQEIFEKANELDARKIDWYSDESEQNRYHEVYEVPTHSHYYAFRRFRTMKNHPVFGELFSCLNNEKEGVDCWAVQSRVRSSVML
ncbi:hypothetical protein LC040_19205 [Bacillus tianshenii]|nr:hypothetical protein LC040_19205 [Bacillus tianshenii]